MSPALFADVTSSMAWPPQSLGEAVMATIVFGVVGILLAILGFKAFDWLTPGDLQEEVLKKNNLSAAIVAAAYVIGICIIIASVVG